MARFDVYPNPDADDRILIPFWLDVQNTFLNIESRVVVPLHASEHFDIMVRNLNPEFTVNGVRVVMNTAALGAVPATDLRRSVANLGDQQHLIQEALDTLFAGY
ncbi:MAG TPA: CcdB family protein [Rhodoferax sp.]